MYCGQTDCIEGIKSDTDTENTTGLSTVTDRAQLWFRAVSRHCSALFSAVQGSARLWLIAVPDTAQLSWTALSFVSTGFFPLLQKSLQTVMFGRENVWMAVIVDYYLYYNGCNECIAADFLRVGGTQWGHSPLITPLQRLIINNARNTRTIRKKYKQVEYGIFICIG